MGAEGTRRYNFSVLLFRTSQTSHQISSGVANQFLTPLYFKNGIDLTSCDQGEASCRCMTRATKLDGLPRCAAKRQHKGMANQTSEPAQSCSLFDLMSVSHSRLANHVMMSSATVAMLLSASGLFVGSGAGFIFCAA